MTARSRIACTAFLWLLAGCQSTPPTAAIQVHCLPMVTYSQADQQAAAAELAVAGPHIKSFIIDYQKMRDANRACIAAGGVQ